MTVRPAIGSHARSYEGSKALYEASRSFTTEGVQHAGRYQSPHPIYMERGEGGMIYDIDGNPYIDFQLGSGPLILGHRHPAVVKAVEQQMAKSQLYGAASKVDLELARQIRERVPSAQRFASSDLALRRRRRRFGWRERSPSATWWSSMLAPSTARWTTS